MTMETLGWIEFKTHRVVVSRDDLTDRIYCFKHTKSRCEFDSFASEELAAEYIIEPLATVQYYVNTGDSESM